jgi:hypothetical protein
MSQNDTKQQTNRYSTNKLAVTFFSASTQEEEEDGRSVANMNTIYLSSKVRWSSQQQGSCAGSVTPSRKMGRRSSSAAKLHGSILSSTFKPVLVGWVGTSLKPAGYIHSSSFPVP